MDPNQRFRFNFNPEAHLNSNSNASKPGNVNPEFGANEPGCGCTFSYNGGAGAGTASCCDDGKPYEEGFNDKKRDPTCCESSRCYQTPLVNKKATDSCSSSFKYVPEFNYPPPACPPQESCCAPKQPCKGGNTENCSATFKYVPEFKSPVPPCPPQGAQAQSNSGSCCDTTTYQGGLTNKKPDGVAVENCCRDSCMCEPDTYEAIANTDAQRYKGKGLDRRNFYADDECSPCQKSNNASRNNNLYDGETDWSEIRRLAYAAVDNCSSCSPKMSRRAPSFYCEDEHYVKDVTAQLTRGR